MTSRTWRARLLFAAVLAAGGCADPSDRIPVIFDHDGATDDYVALLMLAGSGCCDLRGVTVSYGLGYRDAAVEASGLLLTAMGLDAPVAGHNPSLRGPNSFPDDWRDMSEHVRALPMLQGLNPPPPHPDAVELLTELIEDTDDPITIVATGPLTNVAAVLARRPDIIANIERLVVMGGALRVPGNVQRSDTSGGASTAEYNFFVDPGAADQVLALSAQGLGITITPLDVTNELPLGSDWLAGLRGEDTFGARLAAGILTAVEPQISAGRYYLWDGATVLALLRPDSLRFETHVLGVEQAGPHEGGLRIVDGRSGQARIATGLADGDPPLEYAAAWLNGAVRRR